MGYRELPLQPHPKLHIDGTDYDVDYFGMDDGFEEDPGDAFRFIFQLGDGLMIYLYVIQAGGRGHQGHFFHTFWLKDCAVAWVEMEDKGPPAKVTAVHLDLPLNYAAVTLRGRAHQVFALGSQVFSAEQSATGKQELTMRFALESLDAAGNRAPAGKLTWTRRRGWELEAQGTPSRQLEAEEWLEFTPPS